MKKLLALLLAMTMALALVACGGNGNGNNAANNGDVANNTTNDTTNNTGDSEDTGDTTAVTNPDDIADSMTSEDGKYQVAFVTDVGQLKDKSSNQGTFDGVKLYAANNGLSYKYYQPANGNEARSGRAHV